MPGVAHPFIQAYTYDELNRLATAEETKNSSQEWKQTFVYDRYGNRNFATTSGATTTLPSGFDPDIYNPTVNTANNRFSSGQGYSYDASGNTTLDAENRKFTYDAENKQVKVETVDGSGNPTATIGEYFYDGDGKRTKKFVPGTGETTVFVYDAMGRLIQEHSTVVQTGSNAKTVYTTNDALGSPRVNTDGIGSVISRHDYHPFGEEVTRTGYGSDTIRKQFTGYERDGETNLDYAQARYFNSGFGRFSTPDPYGGSGFVRYPQTWNRYSYCLNRPLVFIDPTGEIWLTNDGGNNHIWVGDKDYEKNKDRYSGYSVSNGAVIKLKEVSGFGKKYKNLIGSFVSLNSNGTLSAAAEPAVVEVRGEYSDEEITSPTDYYDMPTFLGSSRTPRGGEPNTYDKYFNKGGGYTLRWRNKFGDAIVDIDFGHDHGAGDPHVHWWDDESEVPRGPGQPVPPDFSPSTDKAGDPVLTPPGEVLNPLIIIPGRLFPMRPSPVRLSSPVRVPLRVPVMP